MQGKSTVDLTGTTVTTGTKRREQTTATVDNDVEEVMTDATGSKRKISLQNSKDRTKKQRQDGSVIKMMDPKINHGSKPGECFFISLRFEKGEVL